MSINSCRGYGVGVACTLWQQKHVVQKLDYTTPCIFAVIASGQAVVCQMSATSCKTPFILVEFLCKKRVGTF